MLLTTLLLHYLLVLPTRALPSGNNLLLLSSELNGPSNLTDVSPEYYLCFTPVQARAIQLPQCIDVLAKIVNEPNYRAPITYLYNHFALIHSWYYRPCAIVFYRDRVNRRPPYKITLSYKEVVSVALATLKHCEESGHGGYAGISRGYAVATGDARATPGLIVDGHK